MGVRGEGVGGALGATGSEMGERCTCTWGGGGGVEGTLAFGSRCLRRGVCVCVCVCVCSWVSGR